MRPFVRALLVEDDEDDYTLTSRLLADVADTDYEITWVRNVDQAVALLEAGDHDVCLLDFHLGGDTGIDVLHRIEGRSTVPCVLLTGQSNPDTDREAMEAGASDYLVKGQFDERVLERSIRYALGNAEALRSLRESEERFRSVVEAATDGIALLDSRGLIVTCNQAMEAEFGVGPQGLEGRPFLSLIADRSSDIVGHLSDDQLEGTLQASAAEATGKRVDGSLFPLEATLSTWVTEEAERFWSVIVRDMTERKELADRLVHQAFHDSLTGLANRALLRARIDGAIAKLDRTDGAVALLFLDLDDFKRTNDSFGHEVGDQLLSSVAARLLGCVRGGEIVARLGGDEFAVCIEDLHDPRSVLRLADRIVHSMSSLFNLADKPIRATCSIGIAITTDSASDADELLRHADVAMYAAKAAGKNRYEVFEDSMHGEIVERMRLETDLREAVLGGLVRVEYQPVVELETSRIVGFEALARWRCPERGHVSPAVFISVAEESGLIEQLGRATLYEAIRQAAVWKQQFPDRMPFSIAVNLSNRQLNDPGLVDFVGNLLGDSGLAPQALTLEITETAMVEDVDHAIEMLQKFRELGVRLALDDFGTGYSSLSYLHLMPLDVVKVDQAFIARIGDDKGASMVKAIAAIAESLKLQVIAEGIEEDSQREYLLDAGYHYGQGFLYSKSVSADDATQLLMLDGEGESALWCCHSSSADD